jgi:hypothetical protein
MYADAIEAQAGMLKHVRQIATTPVGGRAASSLYKGVLDDYQPALKRMLMTLEDAVPVYWDFDLCGVLEAAAPSMPDWELKIDLLPAQAGFIHFAHALSLPMPPDDTIREAIRDGRRSRDLPLNYSLDMTGMAWQVLDGNEVFISNFLRTSWRPAGEPGLMHITQEGMQLSDIVQRLRGIHRNQPMYIELGDQATPHDALMERRAELQVRYIAAAFDFMCQPLLTTRRHVTADRATRRRAEKARLPAPPPIQVIELRRKEYLKVDEADEAPGEGDREYRHRWMVGLATGGYWQRYHVGTGRTGTIRRLILPYMKLADRTDLPILTPRKTVIVVDQ